MSLSQTVRKFIEKEELFSSDDLLLCGVSGGMDSMAMLDLLRSEGYHLIVAHVNYRLRGSHSDQDAQLVRDYCRKSDVLYKEYVVSDIEVADLQESNLQEKARTIRYRWFEELLRKHDYSYICLAHHQEDVVETYFLHALRASGLQGMQSIQPKSGFVRRPLLSCSKHLIEKYIEDQDISYRVDGSNSESKYDRNYIRNDIIQTLKERWPNLTNSIFASACHLSSEHRLLSDLVSNQLSTYITSSEDILRIGPISDLYKVSAHVNTLLFYQLRKNGFNKAQIEDMMRRIDTSGRIWLSDSHQISVKDDHILLKSREYNEVFKVMEGPGEYSFPKGKLQLSPSTQITQSRTSSIEIVDQSKIKWPLTCRRWCEGDKMMPIGMYGKSKLISDMLIDAKVSILQKRDQLVIIDSNDQIIWLVYQRLSDHVKYDKKTETYLKLEWVPA